MIHNQHIVDFGEGRAPLRVEKIQSIQYISAHVDPTTMDYDGYITSLKERLIYDLLKAHPSMLYYTVTFEMHKPDSSELRRLVEQFSLWDGRYFYNGDAVSREFLEEKLAKRDYKIVMTAWVGSGEAEKSEQ